MLKGDKGDQILSKENSIIKEAQESDHEFKMRQGCEPHILEQAQGSVDEKKSFVPKTCAQTEGVGRKKGALTRPTDAGINYKRENTNGSPSGGELAPKNEL